MADTPRNGAKASRFAGRVEDLHIEDLEILANIDQRNARPGHELADLLAQCDSTAPRPDDEAQSEGPQHLDPSRFSPENQRRLSAPGLRTFLAIADLWGLTEEERRLGSGLNHAQ